MPQAISDALGWPTPWRCRSFSRSELLLPLLESLAVVPTTAPSVREFIADKNLYPRWYPLPFPGYLRCSFGQVKIRKEGVAPFLRGVFKNREKTVSSVMFFDQSFWLFVFVGSRRFLGRLDLAKTTLSSHTMSTCSRI